MPGGKQEKIKAYADDTMFVLSENEGISKVINKFTKYREVSGSKINIEKTTMMTIGKRTDITKPPLGIKEKEEIELYGLFFSNEED